MRSPTSSAAQCGRPSRGVASWKGTRARQKRAAETATKGGVTVSCGGAATSSNRNGAQSSSGGGTPAVPRARRPRSRPCITAARTRSEPQSSSGSGRPRTAAASSRRTRSGQQSSSGTAPRARRPCIRLRTTTASARGGKRGEGTADGHRGQDSQSHRLPAPHQELLVVGSRGAPRRGEGVPRGGGKAPGGRVPTLAAVGAHVGLFQSSCPSSSRRWHPLPLPTRCGVYCGAAPRSVVPAFRAYSKNERGLSNPSPRSM